MNSSHKNQYVPMSEGRNDNCWTAGPVIDSHDAKGFNRSGEEMKVHDMTTYDLEVFPPQELASHMQQPSPDIAGHSRSEGADRYSTNKGRVSFLAHVSMPHTADDSAVEIILVSTQSQDGGIYKHEIEIPRHLLCVRDSPVDTVLETLNNAWRHHRWYPPY